MQSGCRVVRAETFQREAGDYREKETEKWREIKERDTERKMSKRTKRENWGDRDRERQTVRNTEKAT